MARVLVVDDDHDILKLAKAVLSHEKHIVLTASDAIQAMDILDNQIVDLLISDANMPHYSGFELVQTIKKNPKFSALPIAMLTGLRERKDIEKAIRVGVDDYIVKPIDPMILIQKVGNLLKNNPPQSHPKIEFSKDSSESVALLSFQIDLVAISETEIHVRSSNPLQIGQVIDLHSEFFRSMGEDPPPMKVFDSYERNGETLYKVIYMGAKESFLQKIRKWIFNHGQSTKAA